MYNAKPPPLSFPAAVVLSAQNKERPGSSTAALLMVVSSQVSLKIATQLSILCETILSQISSSLRRRLGRARLCGLASSLAFQLLHFPLFCVRSSLRLLSRRCRMFRFAVNCSSSVSDLGRVLDFSLIPAFRPSRIGAMRRRVKTRNSDEQKQPGALSYCEHPHCHLGQMRSPPRRSEQSKWSDGARKNV
ncbi:hypothetical protein CRENBAI_000598 [Crenichthys baileyi]|uniref:Uncharacterized protein n=1 Tax=Crenichthys baileyi TaxID=28760 RepID=A0AAV9RVS8_9TELE